MKQSHKQKHVLFWRLTAEFWLGKKKTKSASQRQRRLGRRFPRPTSLPDGRFCSLMLPSSVFFWYGSIRNKNISKAPEATKDHFGWELGKQK